MAPPIKPKKLIPSSQSNLCTTLFFITLFTIPILFLLHTSNSSPLCSSSHSSTNSNPPFFGDLRAAEFSWNRLSFLHHRPNPPTRLKIAVFSRKWPIATAPGGMERHAHTLHTALSLLGHHVHVFTSPVKPQDLKNPTNPNPSSPQLHFHQGDAGYWRYNKAYEQFLEEDKKSKFDVVHSESVALPHWLARHVPNLAVSWHGIALESLHSNIFQDLSTRRQGEPIEPAFNQSMQGVVPKVLDEIRFFHHYAHHVAISDSCGEMLRDVYQIPTKRVHVILNGVNEEDFSVDLKKGEEFRREVGIPKNASMVFGVAGRLVKDKGHPILYEAITKIIAKHANVYLIVAGSGPWEQRYKDLGQRVLVLGSMSPSKLHGFYNAIDVFVNPTLRPQGLDLTLMEAMMSGKPVMASRFPSIKGSIVVDEEFGFMFAPNVASLAEALEVAVKEGAGRMSQRGKACREYAKSMFTARKMALAYERLFLCIKNVTLCNYP